MTADAEALAYRRLAAAIVLHAMLDASGDGGDGAEARRWLLFHPWAGELLDGLGVDRQRVLAWVGELEPLARLTLEL